MPYKKEKVELDGEKITIKKGALHTSLKVPQSYKFKRSELQRLNKTEVGSSFTFKGKTIKMTALVKKRITLAITLMK
tara:strand:- start:1329 stop:1559 length:231 start_codon:yes stop_codon:yes gene_type:complete